MEYCPWHGSGSFPAQITDAGLHPQASNGACVRSSAGLKSHARDWPTGQIRFRNTLPCARRIGFRPGGRPRSFCHGLPVARFSVGQGTCASAASWFHQVCWGKLRSPLKGSLQETAVKCRDTGVEIFRYLWRRGRRPWPVLRRQGQESSSVGILLTWRGGARGAWSSRERCKCA